VTLLSDRRRFPPYGLAGGEPGRSGRAVHLSANESREIPAKGSVFAKKGDCIVIETPGGGGWGKADPAKGSGSTSGL
jgi:N-methylhydantoinase B